MIPFSSGFSQRPIHASAVCLKTQSGKYKITPKRDRPLTYEMANPPYLIVARKAWNSWNCCKSFIHTEIHKFLTIFRFGDFCSYKFFFILFLYSKFTRWFETITNGHRGYVFTEIHYWYISFVGLQWSHHKTAIQSHSNCIFMPPWYSTDKSILFNRLHRRIAIEFYAMSNYNWTSNNCQSRGHIFQIYLDLF